MVIFQDVLIIIRESYIPNLSAENSVFLLLSNVGHKLSPFFQKEIQKIMVRESYISNLRISGSPTQFFGP